jgi:hypothetical protein
MSKKVNSSIGKMIREKMGYDKKFKASGSPSSPHNLKENENADFDRDEEDDEA